MGRNRRPLTKEEKENAYWLTPKRRWAAILIAEDDMNFARICEELSISRPTLNNWRGHPLFIEAVEEHRLELEREMMRLPIAKRRNRVKGLDEMKRRLLMIVAEREAYGVENPDVIGGKSGHVVTQLKAIGTGSRQEIVKESVFDRALAAEIRAIDEQAAKELGQWTEKGELSLAGAPLVITEIVIDRGEVEKIQLDIVKAGNRDYSDVFASMDDNGDKDE